MKKREAAIVAAYTGVMLGSFSDLHEYIEEIMGRPVFTHELGSEEMTDVVKQAAKKDFVSLVVS
jgi:hypothetical protein